MNTSQLPKLMYDFMPDLLPSSNQSVEQRIHIAASFDSEKIKMIRELMEEEAKSFVLNVCGSFEFPKGKTSYSKDSIESILMILPSTLDKRYLLYQQTK